MVANLGPNQCPSEARKDCCGLQKDLETCYNHRKGDTETDSSPVLSERPEEDAWEEGHWKEGSWIALLHLSTLQQLQGWILQGAEGCIQVLKANSRGCIYPS